MSGKPQAQLSRPLRPTRRAAAADRAPLPETGLDPEDWTAFRALAHDMLDAALDHAEGARERKVWTPVSKPALAALQAPLPSEGEGAAQACADLLQHVLPFPTGNTHPRFFGWVHGAGTPVGIVAEMMAAAMNANVGGRQHGAVFVERQVIDWCRQLFDFPAASSGLIVTGTSMATIVALAVARHKASGGQAGHDGLATLPAPLVGYTSAEAHSSVAKAFELLGLGSRQLRAIAVDGDFRIDLRQLAAAIAADRAAGLRPFCVVGTAGTVNTGAIDDLAGLAELCAAEDLWLHVDGAFGALAIMSAHLKPRLVGIERADSLAFDFHKWMHVPYDAGCVLVRDGDLHRATFSHRPAYLAQSASGLAGGEPWFCDYGPELSRGFRALKVWTAFKTYGTERLGEAIFENCRLAHYLAASVTEHPELELLAPVSLAIACFRYRAPDLPPEALDRLNGEIVTDLQDSGIAAPSTTRLHGQLAIRVNITNHRTGPDDIDRLVDAVVTTGRQRLLAQTRTQPPI